MCLYACMALLPGTAAMAGAECVLPPDMGQTTFKISEMHGRALIEASRPSGGGGKVTVDYGQESYATRFSADGKAQIAIAMFEPVNELSVRMQETAVIHCKVEVPNFKKIYRVILGWNEAVRLDLDVLEPGRPAGGSGNVNRLRPNNDKKQGIGEIDVMITGTEDGSSGQTSYVVADPTTIPAEGAMILRVEYTSRDVSPQPPFCGDSPKSAVPFELTIIQGGKVTRRNYATVRATCGEKLPDIMRLLRLRT